MPVAAIVGFVMSVVVMFVLLTNRDDIVVVVVMFVHNIIFVNNVMFMLDYVTMLDYTTVVGTVIITATTTVSSTAGNSAVVLLVIFTSVVSVAFHFGFSHFQIFLVSTTFVNLHCYRLCKAFTIGASFREGK